MSGSPKNNPAPLSEPARRAIEYLRTPKAIRERAGRIFERGLAGDLAHFAIRLDRLDDAAELVAEVTRAAYPDWDIPYHSRWRHFSIGGVDRVARLRDQLDALPTDERGRALYDLVITSVLLDAGAGPAWRYTEADTGVVMGRSEGLAIASFDMFASGLLSDDPDAPLRADAAALQRVTLDELSAAFQVGPDNPLVGASGRTGLLKRLGRTLAMAPQYFGNAKPRPGGLFDYFRACAVDGALRAEVILRAVLEGLGPIWPGRVTIGSINLGDVWHHDAAGGEGHGGSLVPFHKLSQWLSYSLVEPLEDAGIRVVDLDALTGLAEYRNGGLFIDTGVLEPRHPDVTGVPHQPGSEVIVEWRALTIALLDRVADRVRAIAGKDRASLPLAKVLEGGTWAAGRKLARERRPDGAPPIQIDSDGTVF